MLSARLLRIWSSIFSSASSTIYHLIRFLGSLKGDYTDFKRGLHRFLDFWTFSEICYITSWRISVMSLICMTSLSFRVNLLSSNWVMQYGQEVASTSAPTPIACCSLRLENLSPFAVSIQTLLPPIPQQRLSSRDSP